jgi:parallel beta-helix repeat protein
LGSLGARSGRCANNTVWNIHSIYDGSAAGIYVDGGSNITVELNEVHHSDMGIEIGAENEGRIATQMVVRKNYLHDNDKWGMAFGGYDVK